MRLHIRDPHLLKKLLGACFYLRSAFTVIEITRHRHVLQKREIRDQVHLLEDKSEIMRSQTRQFFLLHLHKVFPFKDDLTGCCLVHAGKCI